jgi:hypothetical protein
MVVEEEEEGGGRHSRDGGRGGYHIRDSTVNGIMTGGIRIRWAVGGKGGVGRGGLLTALIHYRMSRRRISCNRDGLRREGVQMGGREGARRRSRSRSSGSSSSSSSSSRSAAADHQQQQALELLLAIVNTQGCAPIHEVPYIQRYGNTAIPASAEPQVV